MRVGRLSRFVIQHRHVESDRGLTSQEIAREKRVTASQLALAWVLAQGRDIVPIPGSKRRSHLEENAKALDVHLTQRDLERSDEALPPGLAAGERYPDMSLVNR